MGMRVLGLEPKTYGLKGRGKEPVTVEEGVTYDAVDRALTDLLTHLDQEHPDLATEIRALPTLPKDVRAEIADLWAKIMALVEGVR